MYDEIMLELERLGNEKTKKRYISYGAKEPVFGVFVKDLNIIVKKTGKNMELAKKLYNSGNYDAMYLAGIIAEPNKFTKQDFEDWISKAYFSMIADYIVAVSLAETPFALEMAREWLDSHQELKASAGWNTYCWVLGFVKDESINKEEIKSLLKRVEKEITQSKDRVRYAMNNFVIAVGISYIPLHVEALEVANAIGKLCINLGDNNCEVPNATEHIKKAIQMNRLGFKRKNVRC